MIKKIVEMQNVHGHIQKMNTGTIIKFMIVFWLILLAQIKFNKNARKIVIKTLYVLGGVISVFGTVGTTGVLIYKQWKTKNESQILEIEN
jgi:hypothetical protein